MSKVNLDLMMESILDPFTPYDIFNVNDTVVRLVKIRGKYHWHKHDDKDELFIVVKGRMGLNLDNETIELNESEGFVVKQGLMHQSFSEDEAIVMMVEQTNGTQQQSE